jgi:protein phosphatase
VTRVGAIWQHAVLMEEGSIGGAELAWAARTDVGRVRALNEDALLAAPPVFAVADGMGGHDAGEVASALTVERLRTLAGSGPTTMEAVAAELHNINSLLRSARPGVGATMGTTGVGLTLVDHGGVTSWLVFNVGDSRAYCFSDGSLEQLSRDHSYVQELVDAGELQAAYARVHPQRNVVTRALGADAEVRPDYWVRAVRPGDRFLLCSDGLHGELEDGVIGAVMSSELSPSDTVRVLVDLALEAGGRDNVTAVVVDVLAVNEPVEVTTDTRPGEGRAGVAVLEGPGGGAPPSADAFPAEETIPITRGRPVPPPVPSIEEETVRVVPEPTEPVDEVHADPADGAPAEPADRLPDGGRAEVVPEDGIVAVPWAAPRTEADDDPGDAPADGHDEPAPVPLIAGIPTELPPAAAPPPPVAPPVDTGPALVDAPGADDVGKGGQDGVEADGRRGWRRRRRKR